jgi:hypothetical protein
LHCPRREIIWKWKKHGSQLLPARPPPRQRLPPHGQADQQLRASQYSLTPSTCNSNLYGKHKSLIDVLGKRPSRGFSRPRGQAKTLEGHNGIPRAPCCTMVQGAPLRAAIAVAATTVAAACVTWADAGAWVAAAASATCACAAACLSPTKFRFLAPAAMAVMGAAIIVSAAAAATAADAQAAAVVSTLRVLCIAISLPALLDASPGALAVAASALLAVMAIFAGPLRVAAGGGTYAVLVFALPASLAAAHNFVRRRGTALVAALYASETAVAEQSTLRALLGRCKARRGAPRAGRAASRCVRGDLTVLVLVWCPGAQ